MHIIGLDLSLVSTGIVVIDMNKRIIHQSVAGFSLTRDANVSTKVSRLIAISRQILSVVKKFNVKQVGIENYAFQAKGAQNDLGELHGVVKSQLHLAGIEPMLIPPSLGRKKVFDKGRLKKKEIVQKINDLGYTEVIDHNVADALVIALAYKELSHANEG